MVHVEAKDQRSRGRTWPMQLDKGQVHRWEDFMLCLGGLMQLTVKSFLYCEYVSIAPQLFILLLVKWILDSVNEGSLLEKLSLPLQTTLGPPDSFQEPQWLLETTDSPIFIYTMFFASVYLPLIKFNFKLDIKNNRKGAEVIAQGSALALYM